MSLIRNSRPYRMYRTTAGSAGRCWPQLVARFGTGHLMRMAVVALATLAAVAGCSPVPCALGLGRACATTVSAVTVAPSHTFVLKSDGSLWAWGRNASGQLGDGTATDRAGPVQVGPGSMVAAVAAGAVHTVAMRRNGTLWAWGANWSGQLGDGTTTDRAEPVRIRSGSDWRVAAPGEAQTTSSGSSTGETQSDSWMTHRSGSTDLGWSCTPRRPVCWSSGGMPRQTAEHGGRDDRRRSS